MEDIDPIYQHVNLKQLRSQLAEQRYRAHQAEHRLNTVIREQNFEILSLKSLIDAETQKSRNLEASLTQLDEPDDLQLQNFKLRAQVDTLCTQLALLKQETYSHFLERDNNIMSLTEDKQTLEGELRSYQVETLQSTQDLKSALRHLEAAMAKASSQRAVLEQQLQQARKEQLQQQESTKDKLRELNLILKETSKESRKAAEKASEMEASNLRLQQEIMHIEEKNKALEGLNQALKKQMMSHARTISTLESEISEAAQDVDKQRINEIAHLSKQTNLLKAEIKKLRLDLSLQADQKEALQEQFDDMTVSSNKRIQSLEQEKKSLIQNIDLLQRQKILLCEQITENEQQFKINREEMQQLIQSKMMKFKQEKAELQNTIQELSDQVEVDRSFSDHNLQDELYQLGGSHSSKNSTPNRRSGGFDFRFSEKFVSELSDKNLQIVCLKSEKEAVLKEMQDMASANAEAKVARADLVKARAELENFKKVWAEERACLMVRIEETEQIAIEAKIQYAEAATDRDVYYKMYIDSKKRAAQ